MRAAALSQAEFAAFQQLIYAEAGIHLASNKRELVATRLARRLRALDLPDFGAYYQLLLVGDPAGEEREHFVNCLTTNKTHFFREAHHFDFLRDRVIPELHARVAAGAPRKLRVWSAACSSGEEPYSIAMVAHRELARDGYTIEIVASDIDTEILARAEAGVYTQAQIADVPVDLRSRYLTQQRGLWTVSDELRAVVQLHRVNLIQDRFPFTGAFDAIFLRNVIIYFDRPSQAALFRRLHGYLADSSYLFLGHSESLQHLSDLFAPVGQTIYQRRSQRAAARRRGRTTVSHLPADRVLASREPTRIDAIVGPGVGVCVFDPIARLGGMAQIGGVVGAASQREALEIDRLIARLNELGAARGELRAKLAGGGGSTADARERGRSGVALAETALGGAGIPIVSRRVGGDRSLEIRFYTATGRLLCREHEEAPKGERVAADQGPRRR